MGVPTPLTREQAPEELHLTLQRVQQTGIPEFFTIDKTSLKDSINP